MLNLERLVEDYKMSKAVNNNWFICCTKKLCEDNLDGCDTACIFCSDLRSIKGFSNILRKLK